MRHLRLIGTLLLLSCESTSDVVKEKRPQVESVFSSIQSLQAQLIAAPEYTTATVGPLATPLYAEGAHSNAMFIYAEDIAQPGQAKEIALRSLDSLPILQCGSLLKTEKLFRDSITRVSPSIARSYLDACARLRFVLVIRSLGYLRPELQLETKRFAPGRYRGEIVVFDLAEQKLLGGYPFSATNDSRVSLTDINEEHLARLISNLESAIFESIRTATRTAIPSSL